MSCSAPLLQVPRSNKRIIGLRCLAVSQTFPYLPFSEVIFLTGDKALALLGTERLGKVDRGCAAGWKQGGEQGEQQE